MAVDLDPDALRLMLREAVQGPEFRKMMREVLNDEVGHLVASASSNTRWMNVAEAADYLGMSVSSLEKMRPWAEGSGYPRYSQPRKNGPCRYCREWLDDWAVAGAGG